MQFYLELGNLLIHYGTGGSISWFENFNKVAKDYLNECFWVLTFMKS
jgi:hypothetical protein